MGQNKIQAETLAVLVHSKTCRSNHIDQCGWDYEIRRGGIHDWNGRTHKHYLEKAEESISKLIAAGVDIGQAIEAYKIIG